MIGLRLGDASILGVRLRRTHEDPEPVANQHHRAIAILSAYFTYKVPISIYNYCMEGWSRHSRRQRARGRSAGTEPSVYKADLTLESRDLTSLSVSAPTADMNDRFFISRQAALEVLRENSMVEHAITGISGAEGVG